MPISTFFSSAIRKAKHYYDLKTNVLFLVFFNRKSTANEHVSLSFFLVAIFKNLLYL